MANTNAFCRALLVDIRDFYTPAPGDKVTEIGFLSMLLGQPNKPTILQDALSQNGHNKGSVIVKYQTRSVIGQVDDAIGCDLGISQVAKTKTQAINYASQIGLYISDSDMRRYCDDASRTVLLPTPTPGTPFMAEFRTMILSQLNGLYQKIDYNLATAMSTAWGKNVRTGLATATNYTLPLSATVQNLEDGIVQLLGDIEDNEFCGSRPQIVGGSNHFRNYTMQKMRGAMSFNQAGLSASDVMDWDFHYDRKLRTVWGTEYVGIFDQGSTHFIEDNRNVGNFVGNFGSSYFGQIFDPRVGCGSANLPSPFSFDIQIKYLDCPTTLTNYYTDATATYDRGWAFMISKRYDLWTTPTDVYDGADVIAGQNGTLLANILNA